MLQSTVSAAGDAGEAANPLIPSIPDMIVVGISFLVLLFLVYKFIVPNFERTYQARKEAIQGGLEKAAVAQTEAEAAKEQYVQQLQDVQSEANSIRESARTEAAQILEASRCQAQEEAERIILQAQKRLESEREVAQARLRTEIGSLAITLAEKVVGEALTDDARSNRVVDRFLAEMEKAEQGKKNSKASA